MISKERLEELIEQDKVFYWVFNKEIRMLCNLSVPTYWKANWELYGKDCFETREEAEWHKEFGCIERTERLELPTYEWMQPKEDEQDVYYSFYNYKHELMGIRVTKQKIALYKSYRCSDLTSTVDIFDNTKENYTLACRKCVELFLGEKK